jgi:hypothetical protein
MGKTKYSKCLNPLMNREGDICDLCEKKLEEKEAKQVTSDKE